MRVTILDPPAYTPPYDHSLCSALGRRGLAVELATSRFRHAEAPRPDHYARRECFYRLAGGVAAAKAAQHPFDMLRLARRLRSDGEGVVHFQWLPLPQLDRSLIRAFPRPLVLTAHDLLPRAGGRLRRAAARALLSEVDAVVVHSRGGERRLVELGLAPERVNVIPHGSFDYLTRIGAEGALDPATGDLDGRKVVLFFGLVRPHKGVDVLVEAFASAPEDAVLLVVGRPLTPIEPLRERARELGIGDRVRFVNRFLSEHEVPAYFRRAELVVLPYREIEQSGVLFTALAFGRPVIASAVGGFEEVGERGALRLVRPGDPRELGVAIRELLGDGTERDRLAAAAASAAAGDYSWDRAAELTAGLYARLLERSR